MSLSYAAPALVPHPGVRSAVVRPAAAPVVRLDSATTEALVFRHSATHATIIYTVQPGDCLWTIAQKFYGSGGQWVRIFHANPKIIQVPGLIFPGKQLVIPAVSTRAIPTPAPAPAARPAPASSAPAPSLPAPADAIQPGVPWSIFSQPGGQRMAVAFSGALLRAIGAPVTRGNLQVIYDWQVSEGSGGWYNPLNGGDFGGLSVSGQQYGGGANNYPSLAVNVRAMAGILLNDTQYGYGAVVSALRANNPSAARQAIWASQWAASHYNWGGSFSSDPLPV
jgi:LysM repeat protein